MCLDSKKTKAERDKWLAKKSDTVIAYKAVAIHLQHGMPKRLYPPLCSTEFTKYKKDGCYSKVNNLQGQEIKKKVKTFKTKQEYIPYFHFCVTKVGATQWLPSLWNSAMKIVKCEIPKKFITEVGKQAGLITIVAKGFTIVDNDEYFKEEKECA